METRKFPCMPPPRGHGLASRPALSPSQRFHATLLESTKPFCQRHGDENPLFVPKERPCPATGREGAMGTARHEAGDVAGDSKPALRLACQNRPVCCALLQVQPPLSPPAFGTAAPVAI